MPSSMLMKLGAQAERGQAPSFISLSLMTPRKRSWNSKTHGRSFVSPGKEPENGLLSRGQAAVDQALQKAPQPHLHQFGLRPEVR